MRRIPKAFLDAIGVSYISAKPIISFKDCEQAIKTAEKDNYSCIIILILTWVEAPNVFHVLSAADIERKPILL